MRASARATENEAIATASHKTVGVPVGNLDREPNSGKLDMNEYLKEAFQYRGLNDLPANLPRGPSPSYSPIDLASIETLGLRGYELYTEAFPILRSGASERIVGANVPRTSGSRFSNENILEIAAKKRSPTLRCAMCGAPTAGTYYPYCPDCYNKSLDPKGGVPPIPIIIDPLKQMK